MPNGNHGLQGLPMPRGEWAYSDRFLLALDAAATMHAAQRRKGSSVPYVSHLLGTCAIVMEYDGDEEEAIAALLHDTIEDIRPTEHARQTVTYFGERVLAIVEGCTDSDTHPKRPWRQRKERYVAHLAEANASVLLVAAADKLHNARSLLIDLRRTGDAVWSRFNAGRDESLWFYRSVVDAIRSNPAHQRDLVDELNRTVQSIEAMA